MQTLKRYYRVDRRQINFIRFVIEAYEGIAVVTTLDRALGLIGVAVAPGCEAMAGSIISDLSRSILIEAAAAPVPEPQNFYA
jgi:hypothetical protein